MRLPPDLADMLAATRDDARRAPLPGRAHLREAPRQGLGGRERREVPEQVQRSGGGAHRELHAGDHPHAPPPALRGGLGDAGHRVVVGHGQRADAALRRQGDQRRGRQPSVGGGGVCVEVGGGRGGYAATVRPSRPRASSSARTVAALSAGVWLSVRMWTSGLSGASYGSLTPVNSLISPEKAFA